MADSKVSVLNELTGAALVSGDLFYVVDISAGTAGSKRITRDELKTGLGVNLVDNTSDENKPISAATQTALDGKVDENAAITGATKTKITYDAKGLVTSGADATTADIAPSTNRNYVTDAQLVVVGNTSGTNTGDDAVNSLYSGLAASKQDTLVSTVNIKSINGTSILGAGDITISGGGGTPSGTAGLVQFSDGSAFDSDSNFYWDDTNKRLGVGINSSLLARVHVKGTTADSAANAALFEGSGGTDLLLVRNDGWVGNEQSGSSLKWRFDIPNSYFKLERQGVVVAFGAGSAGNAGIFTETAAPMTIGTNGTTRLTLGGSGGVVVAASGANTAHSSVIFEARSTTQGVLFPNMTSAQKNAISSPSLSLLVFDINLDAFCYKGAAGWKTITAV